MAANVNKCLAEASVKSELTIMTYFVSIHYYCAQLGDYTGRQVWAKPWPGMGFNDKAPPYHDFGPSPEGIHYTAVTGMHRADLLSVK